MRPDLGNRTQIFEELKNQLNLSENASEEQIRETLRKMREEIGEGMPFNRTDRIYGKKQQIGCV